MLEPNESAYPETVAYSPDREEVLIVSDTNGSCGFTKREMLAAMAMQGILSSLPEQADYHPAMTADLAVRHADALIDRLNQQEAIDAQAN